MSSRARPPGLELHSIFAEFLSHENLPGYDVTTTQAETLLHVCLLELAVPLLPGASAERLGGGEGTVSGQVTGGWESWARVGRSREGL